MEFEDLRNEFHAFKWQMSNVCQKYNTNFQKVEASESLAYRGFVAHEAAISLINERCMLSVQIKAKWGSFLCGCEKYTQLKVGNEML